MKKKHLAVAVVVALTASLTLSSCLGSFAMFNKVKAWNEQVGDKFVNEVVFVAMWILPVYQLSFAADLLVLNAVEFWSGTNPMTAQTQIIDGKDARYLVSRDATGYVITNLKDNSVTRFNFNAADNSWSIQNGADGPEVTFMTFVDDQHASMLTPDGSFTIVELSQAGVYAYQQLVGSQTLMAQR